MPVILKTKYAFHALLWLLEPSVVLDIGSMDGSDSKRFRGILKHSEMVAFEANPDNFRSMNDDEEIKQHNIRILNRMVSCTDGFQSFYIQRTSNPNSIANRGTSSALPRIESGMQNIEVCVSSQRIDSFLTTEYPSASKVALWVDVEGFSYEVLESMLITADRICLIHVEVEAKECWKDQRLEPDVVRLLSGMGFILLACGKPGVQRDLVFVNKYWYSGMTRSKIDFTLKIARWIGPSLSGVLSHFLSR